MSANVVGLILIGLAIVVFVVWFNWIAHKAELARLEEDRK